MIRLYLYTIRKIVKFSCVRASETRVRPRSRRWPVGREGQRRIELRWKPDFASRSVHEPSSPDYVGKNRRKMPKRYSPPVFVPLNQPRPLWECAIFFPSGEHPVWTSTWYFVIPIFGIFTKSILGARDSWEIARFRDLFYYRYTIAI